MSLHKQTMMYVHQIEWNEKHIPPSTTCVYPYMCVLIHCSLVDVLACYMAFLLSVSLV